MFVGNTGISTEQFGQAHLDVSDDGDDRRALAGGCDCHVQPAVREATGRRIAVGRVAQAAVQGRPVGGREGPGGGEGRCSRLDDAPQGQRVFHALRLTLGLPKCRRRPPSPGRTLIGATTNVPPP